MPRTAVQSRPVDPTLVQPPLPLKDITNLANRLAHRVARNPADLDDLQQLGLFEYHQAMTDTPSVSNPYGFARTVLLRAMWRFYSNPNGMEEVSLSTHSDSDERALDTLYELGTPDTSASDSLELGEYLDHLEKACGPVARSIAENLISPSGECAEAIVAKARRQAEKQQNATAATKKHQPRGVKGEIRLSHPVVCSAMGISHRSWWAEVNKIRAFTREWLDRCA